MRNGLVCIAAAVAILFSAGAAQAVETLVYSYEALTPAGPDGFFGVGATVTQDTIGATVGANSMKYEVAAGPTFVGARTESLNTAILGNPPGVNYVLFDMTIVEPFTGIFADLGITVFGHALNAVGGAQFGLQAEFADRVPIGGRAAGLYPNLRLDLSSSTNPVTFAGGESFNQIFGPGATQLTVASAFQFLLNKSGDAPVTVYIDNVRLGIPEPTTFALVGLGAVMLGGMRRRRNG